MKKLSEEEVEELKELITNKNKIAIYIALIGAITAMISAIGTTAAAIITAIRSSSR